MIRVKAIVEIIYECNREDMDKKVQKMPLTDLRNCCSSAFEEELKSCLGEECEVHTKSVEVTEE